MLVGRLYKTDSVSQAALPMAVFSGLAILPDLDYLGVMLGVPDTGPCGHRGASHSLVAPLLVALATAAAAPLLKVPRWRASICAGLVVASHSLLDAFTVSGRGLPLLWPLTFHRFGFPWRFIPNAPCGLEFISMAGLRAASIELLMFFPAVAFALRPGAPRRLRALPVLADRGTPSDTARPS
jgi:inner membrane protein